MDVLIESDWNLKDIRVYTLTYKYGVLIESDWNLKLAVPLDKCKTATVLIESDWNLKMLAFAFNVPAVSY